MKKQYETIKCEITSFENENIITTSGGIVTNPLDPDNVTEAQ